MKTGLFAMLGLMMIGLSSIGIAPSYAGYVSEVLKDSPQAYYRMEEAGGNTAFDSSVGNLNAAINGSLTYHEAGPIMTESSNYAFGRSGVSQFDNLVATSSIFGRNIFSYEIWVKTSNAGVYMPVSAWKGADTGAIAYLEIYQNLAYWSIFDSNSNNASQVHGTTVLTDGTWHHLVATVNMTARRMKVYVDGKLEGEKYDIVPGSIFNNQPSTWQIPGNTDPIFANFRFKGIMDEAAFYTTELSAAQVLAHYQAATPAALSTSIGVAKKLPIGTFVSLSGSITAVFGGSLYIEDSGRVCGIRVDNAGTGFSSASEGRIVNVSGVVQKDPLTLEIYIGARTIDETPDFNVLQPLVMTNKAIGGGDFIDQVTGNGQIGVVDGTGTNNIGLLVRTSGTVSAGNADGFTLTDGSGVALKVSRVGVGATLDGKYATVTGISSILPGRIRLIKERTVTAGSIEWLSFPDSRMEVDGLAWFAENKPSLSRLPVRLKDTFRSAVWGLALNPSGGRIRFKTTGTMVGIRAQSPAKAVMYHITSVAQNGFDVYVDGVFFASTAPDSTGKTEATWQFGTDHQLREVTIYLPLYNEVTVQNIAVEGGAFVSLPKPFTVSKPVVYYGSSITQGGCASNPGLTFPAIISRKLDAEFVNLGLDGNGLGDLEVARAIAEIDSSAIVLDHWGNIGQRLGENLPLFVGAIRETRPNVPIIVNGPYTYAVDKYNEAQYGHESQRKMAEDFVKSATANGDAHIYYYDGRRSISQNELSGLVDGIHPNSLGMSYIANALGPVIEGVIH